jgi:hypothetical protein
LQTVAKKKNSIALFEAISKSKEKNTYAGVSVPAWLSKVSQPQDPGQPPVENPPAIPGSAPYGGPKIVLSGAGLVLILAVIVTVGAAGFLAGRATAPGKTSENAVTGYHRPGASVTDGLAPAEPVDLPARMIGKQYLVIQRLAGMTKNDWKEANEIADWLVRQKGEKCEAKIIQVRNDKFLAVWSLRTFDSYLSPEAQKYAEHIETLGREFKTTEIYKTSTGKYTFSQHRQGKLDPYYVVYKGP